LARQGIRWQHRSLKPGATAGPSRASVHEALISDQGLRMRHRHGVDRQTPKRILHAHPADQCAQLRVDLRSPSLGARLTTPVGPKAGPVPTHECLGPDDRKKRRMDGNQRYSWIKNQRSWFVSRTRPCGLRLKTFKMSKHRVLNFKPQRRLEWRGQDGQNETEQPDHSASLSDSIMASTRIRFSVHTGVFLMLTPSAVHS
jgi:hypothetical protein